MNNFTHAQDMPKRPETPISITDAVITDLNDRRRLGIAKYGMQLMAHNGRDALVDLYQELTDATLYLRQHLVERRAIANDLDIMSLGIRDYALLLYAMNTLCVQVGIPQMRGRFKTINFNYGGPDIANLRDKLINIVENLDRQVYEAGGAQQGANQ